MVPLHNLWKCCKLQWFNSLNSYLGKKKNPKNNNKKKPYLLPNKHPGETWSPGKRSTQCGLYPDRNNKPKDERKAEIAQAVLLLSLKWVGGGPWRSVKGRACSMQNGSWEILWLYLPCSSTSMSPRKSHGNPLADFSMWASGFLSPWLSCRHIPLCMRAFWSQPPAEPAGFQAVSPWVQTLHSRQMDRFNAVVLTLGQEVGRVLWMMLVDPRPQRAHCPLLNLFMHPLYIGASS